MVWHAQGLAIVNDRLQLYAKQHSEEVTCLDCGAIFFEGLDRLSDELLPDALHPSAAGDQTFCAKQLDCITVASNDFMLCSQSIMRYVRMHWHDDMQI